MHSIAENNISVIESVHHGLDNRQRIIEGWKVARYDLLGCPSRFLLPAIKLREIRTHAPWRRTYCPGVVIKLNELLSKNGMRALPIYEEIKRCGGLNDFLGFKGQIILSTIMPDRVILGLSKERYAQCIDDLRPTFYLTPDGENYFNRPNTSSVELSRMVSETEYLIKSGLEAKPLGLVKGCCEREAVDHCNKLMNLGIDHHVLHVGNCLYRSTLPVQKKIFSIYREVSAISPWILIYGVGSRRNFNLFSRCNGYVTQSHFVHQFENGEDGLLDDSINENLKRSELELLKQEANRVMDGKQTNLDRW